MSKGKSVIQYGLDGKFIKIWKTRKEASEKTNTNYQGISKCCRGKQQRSGGFFWKFLEGGMIINLVMKKPIAKKQIIQKDLNGKFIRNWPSILKASDITGVNSSAIDFCLTYSKMGNKAGNFIWENGLTLEIVKDEKATINFVDKPNPKKVELTKTENPKKAKKVFWLINIFKKRK